MTILIKLVGIGGQGIQFAGGLLGEAAFKQGLNVSQGTNYEPATSGGLTLADISIASLEKEILYPFIEYPDILVVFAQRGWDMYKHTVDENTFVIADLDNVQDLEGAKERTKHIFHLPFSAKARELGSENVTNVIVVGFLAEMLDVGDHFVVTMLRESHPNDMEEYELLEVSPENFEDSLIDSSPEKFKELNLQAFRLGYKMSQELDYDRGDLTV